MFTDAQMHTHTVVHRDTQCTYIQLHTYTVHTLPKHTCECIYQCTHMYGYTCPQVHTQDAEMHKPMLTQVHTCTVHSCIHRGTHTQMEITHADSWPSRAVVGMSPSQLLLWAMSTEELAWVWIRETAAMGVPWSTGPPWERASTSNPRGERSGRGDSVNKAVRQPQGAVCGRSTWGRLAGGHVDIAPET